jgi:hypothetical protein
VRLDLDKIDYVRCIWLNFFWLPRMLLVGSLMALWTVFLIPLMIGAPTDRPVERWRYRLITALAQPSLRLGLLSSGVVWIDFNKTYVPDYKRFLGPDWKPRFEGAGISVSNHMSWIDVIAFTYLVNPGYLSK